MTVAQNSPTERNDDSNSLYWFVAGAALTAGIGSFAFAYTNETAAAFVFAFIALIGGLWIILRDTGESEVTEA